MLTSKTLNMELTEQEYKAVLRAVILADGMKRLEADEFEELELLPEQVEKNRADADALSCFSRKLVHAYQHAAD